jgi:hypothetical protein
MEVGGQLYAPAALPSAKEAGCSPEASLDFTEKRKISCLYQESNPDFSVVQPIILVAY